MTDYNKKSTENSTVTEVAKKGARFLGHMAGQEIKSEAEDLQKSIVEDVTASAKDYAFNNLDSILFKVYKASSNALQKIIFGEVRANRGRARTSVLDRPSYTKVDYQAASKQTTVKTASTNITKVNGISFRPKSNFDFDQIIFGERDIAESYLEEMRSYIEQYGCMDVASFYRLVGRPTDGNFTLKEYVWDNLDKASVHRVFDGQYILDLPEPKKG